MTCPSLRAEPILPASCGGAAPSATPILPGDTVATLAARIRAERCGRVYSLSWLYTPEQAAEMMLGAERQRLRLKARYA